MKFADTFCAWPPWRAQRAAWSSSLLLVGHTWCSGVPALSLYPFPLVIFIYLFIEWWQTILTLLYDHIWVYQCFYFFWFYLPEFINKHYEHPLIQSSYPLLIFRSYAHELEQEVHVLIGMLLVVYEDKIKYLYRFILIGNTEGGREPAILCDFGPSCSCCWGRWRGGVGERKRTWHFYFLRSFLKPI